MRKVKVKVPAKVNLTLDVLGLDGGYHSLKSFVASVNVFDTITVKARRDGKITLENRGVDVGCDITDNNAYKGAKSFIDTFGTCGVDIVIDKKIPVGGGLGGSSADIAGVLNALNRLFETDMNMEELAAHTLRSYHIFAAPNLSYFRANDFCDAGPAGNTNDNGQCPHIRCTQNCLQKQHQEQTRHTQKNLRII